MKRGFDFSIALVGFLLLLPVVAVTAILVLTFMGRPILFRQVRPGYLKRPFTLLKFRTMRPPVAGAESDSQRLTPLGSLLRKLSLDELPQLWNVLKGEMSLVGPRPLLTQYLERYTPEQARRHDVRPGITGWAQVSGRNSLTWEQKFCLDVWYVDHQSFALDMKIIWMTFRKVLKREGIRHPGFSTMEEFLGSPSSQSNSSSGPHKF